MANAAEPDQLPKLNKMLINNGLETMLNISSEMISKFQLYNETVNAIQLRDVDLAVDFRHRLGRTLLDWFHGTMIAIKNNVIIRQLWENGLIYGFASWQTCENLLLTVKHPNTCILRFSKSNVGSVVLAWLANGSIRQTLVPFENDKVNSIENFVTLLHDLDTFVFFKFHAKFIYGNQMVLDRNAGLPTSPIIAVDAIQGLCTAPDSFDPNFPHTVSPVNAIGRTSPETEQETQQHGLLPQATMEANVAAYIYEQQQCPLDPNMNI